MDMTREELDAKLEALEACSDSKFERMFAQMQTAHADLRIELRESHAELSAKIDALAARSVDKVTAVGMLIGAIALVFAMISFGGDQFVVGREVGVAIAALEARVDRLQSNPPSPAAAPAPSSPAANPKAASDRK